MRTEIEALKEIRDRISYFCSRTDGKYDPPWAQEVIGIIDDVLITPYRQCKRFGAPFYVEVGTSIVAIRCASNHDVVWRADHSVHGKATVDWAESVCTRMNQEANRRERGDCAKLREALKRAWLFVSATCESFAFVHEGRIERGKLCDDIDAALAAPPRNCDMGTAEEQSQRFDAFCDEHKYVGDDGANWCSRTCPCYNDINCGVNWAQMPYVEKEGGAK